MGVAEDFYSGLIRYDDPATQLAAALGCLGEAIQHFLEVAKRLGQRESAACLVFPGLLPTMATAWEEVQKRAYVALDIMSFEPEAYTEVMLLDGSIVSARRDPTHRELDDLIQSVSVVLPLRRDSDTGRHSLPVAEMDRLGVLARDWLYASPLAHPECERIRVSQAMAEYGLSRSGIDRANKDPKHPLRKIKEPGASKQRPAYVLRKHAEDLAREMGTYPPQRRPDP